MVGQNNEADFLSILGLLGKQKSQEQSQIAQAIVAGQPIPPPVTHQSAVENLMNVMTLFGDTAKQKSTSSGSDSSSGSGASGANSSAASNIASLFNGSDKPGGTSAVGALLSLFM